MNLFLCYRAYLYLNIQKVNGLKFSLNKEFYFIEEGEEERY